MNSYDTKGLSIGASFSYYAGELDNGVVEHRCHDDYCDRETRYSHSEWWGDLAAESYMRIGYFVFGIISQSITPILQVGTVSRHFGLTGWANLTAPVGIFAGEDSVNILNRYSGGGMAVEQIQIGENWRLGLFEYFSRNGREVYKSELDNICEGVCIGNGFPSPRPEFYKEVGAGIYVSRLVNSAGRRFALELRYGRDLDYKKNRFAVTLDMDIVAWPFSE